MEEALVFFAINCDGLLQKSYTKINKKTEAPTEFSTW